MLLDVSPTRMEKLALKKKLKVAKRGHKLLKDKLDQLVRILLGLIKETKETRKIVNEKFYLAEKFLQIARSDSFSENIEAALISANREIKINSSVKKILNVKLPETQIELNTPLQSYGFLQTNASFDKSIDLFDEAIIILINLAAKEQSIRVLAEEVITTKRRVNALEYILIPNIEETIKFITMRLEEQERNAKTQIMKIKSNIKGSVSHAAAHTSFRQYKVKT
jgi:V/A-type H+/Na+-transporting ATPase subunit D